jgi:hypothetical protein
MIREDIRQCRDDLSEEENDIYRRNVTNLILTGATENAISQDEV